MFEKGSLIIYGNSGVCRVEDVGRPGDIPMADKNKPYYTLTPLFGKGTIYIPVDTSIFMRPVISRNDADKLLDAITDIPEDACQGKDPKVQAEQYRASLHTHKCEDLVHIIKSIYVKGKGLAENGRRLGQIDQEYLKRAEELLYGEFSVVFNIPFEDVQDYIEREVSWRECQKSCS